MFALIDCNSFYCSCERVFNPRLRKKPLIVLSNNDGVTISRSDEAKALGIKMGDPFYKIKTLCREKGIYAFSSNYTLYGDMSARVMNILSKFTPEIEVYSIDEAFLNLRGFHDLEAYGQSIYETLYRCTGIPVGVGIGPTKVLAKIANKIAKNRKHISPVYDLSSKEVQEIALSTFPVEDIWGIGRKSSVKLNAMGIYTAKELRDADPDFIQKVLTVVGRKIMMELSGVSCMELELFQEAKKQIISSRSFGRPVFELNELKEAVSHYVSTAAEKLRMQGSVCGHLQVFVHTNRFKAVSQYYNAASLSIPTPTASTTDLIKIAHQGLESIFKQGIEYKKAGVIFNDIRSSEHIQFSLFDDRDVYVRNETLMKVMDKINKDFGSGTIQAASSGLSPRWKMKSELISPCYTTRWSDLLKVK